MVNAHSIRSIIGRAIHTRTGINGGQIGSIVGEHLGDTTTRDGSPATHVLIDGVEYKITVTPVG
jgi:hypothetical protein